MGCPAVTAGVGFLCLSEALVGVLEMLQAQVAQQKAGVPKDVLEL